MRLVNIGTGLAVAGAVHAVVNVRLMRRPPAPPLRARRGVSVLVPARDEAANIGDCVRSLRLQDVDEIIVLDDGSADGTADAARGAAGHDARVRVLAGASLPPGWLGKPHACAQLAAHADTRSDVLAFVDADVRLMPDAIGRSVQLLDDLGLDLISPYPRQLAESWAERIVQPLQQWSWLSTLALRLAERSPRHSLGAATGQFLVIRRSTYERAGGHAAVRDAVLEDLALLRAVKDVGGRGGVVDGTDLAECRMYDGWSELRDGYSKSLWAAFGSPPRAIAVVGALCVAYVLPPVAALRGSRAGALGYAAAMTGRMIAARATAARQWPDALAHPASIVLACYLILRSLVLHRRGGLTWKGRAV